MTPATPTQPEQLVHDGSLTPAAIELPELWFRARCASPQCKALLGGFHIPASVGMVVFSCPRCGLTTVFRLGEYGIQARLAGPLAGGVQCPPSGVNAVPRMRGQRGGRGR